MNEEESHYFNKSKIYHAECLEEMNNYDPRETTGTVQQ